MVRFPVARSGLLAFFASCLLFLSAAFAASGADRKSADAQLAEARAAYARDRFDTAISVASEAARSFRKMGNKGGEIDALMVTAEADRRMAKYQAAERAIQQAYRLALRSRDRKRLGSALTVWGDIAERQKDMQRAIGLYLRALAVFRRPQDWREDAAARFSLSDIYVSNGDYDKARIILETAAEEAEAAGDFAVAAKALDHLGYLHRELGDYGRASLQHKAALNAAAKIADPRARDYARARAYNHLGIVTGRIAASRARASEPADSLYSEAIASEREALAAAMAAENPQRVSYVLRALSSLLQDRAELETGSAAEEHLRQSLEAAQRALQLAEQTGEREWEGLALNLIGRAQALLGDTDAAERSLQRAAALWDEIGDVHARGTLQLILGQTIYERHDRLQEALTAYERARQDFGRASAVNELAVAWVRSGKILRTSRALRGSEEGLYGRDRPYRRHPEPARFRGCAPCLFRTAYRTLRSPDQPAREIQTQRQH